MEIPIQKEGKKNMQNFRKSHTIHKYGKRVSNQFSNNYIYNQFRL